MHETEALSIWTITALIFAAVILAKVIAKKSKTVDVLWLIVIGSVLGNLGWIPKDDHALEYIGEIGIIFIMFALGFEESLNNFVQGLKKAWGIATIGAIFPFMAGYFSADMLGYGHSSAMVWGLTMTATAVSLTMMSLKSSGMHRTKAATGIMTAAVVDDVLSLIGVAIIIPIILASAVGGATMEMAGNHAQSFIVFMILLKVVIFFVIIMFVGLFAFPERKIGSKDKSIRNTMVKFFDSFYRIVGVKKLLLIHEGEFTALVVIFIAVSMGALANAFGFHPAIGAYFAGLFLHDDYFVNADEKNTHTNKHLDNIKKFIDNVAFIIFGPIFFVNLGAKLIFDWDVLLGVLPDILNLFLLVLVLQVLSAGLAARFTGRYAWHESVLIGLGMLGRAELAFIVINIAFVQNQIIATEEFYVLMFTAFLLNITVPLAIKWWEPYYKGEKRFAIGKLVLSKEQCELEFDDEQNLSRLQKNIDKI